MRKDRKSIIKKKFKEIREDFNKFKEYIKNNPYEMQYRIIDGKFQLCKIRIYCRHGHLMKGRRDLPGKQWCRQCTKINRERQRYWK